METVQAATISVGAGATTSVVGLGVGNWGPLRVLVRTPDTGVFVGNSGVSGVTNGYELLPNVEYVLVLRPTTGNSSSASNSLNVHNDNGAGSITLSWLATAEV